MAFLFRNRPKSNAELVKSTKDLTLKLSEEPKVNPKVRGRHYISSLRRRADSG
jgi:calcium binding protein 39